MVGLEKEKLKIMEELAGNQSCRLVIPIVGAGGIGKTTLARNVYDDKFTEDHFDVRVWVTISQDYNVTEIFSQVLSSLKEQRKAIMDGEHFDENVRKSLWGRRYIVVFDDIWSIDVWNKIQRFFPDNDNGSRIMVTTRLSNLANELSSISLGMKYLDENDSWSLLCEKVFGQGSCPVDELEKVGKKIVKDCRGLPLAIVVIGGLLSKSKTLEYWNQIEDDFSTSIYLTDDEQCSKILFLSYNQFSAHLKPCFLYLGVFPEDEEILVTQLTKLWIAEGFLKPIRGKQLEEIAEVYLKELVERNMVIVSQWGKTGKIKAFTIHDLLRELCLKEAQKEKFFCLVNEDGLYHPQSLNCYRRFVINVGVKACRHLEVNACSHCIPFLASLSQAHSLIFWTAHHCVVELDLGFLSFESLRVLTSIGYILALDLDYRSKLSNLINLRYLDFHTHEEIFDDILAPKIGLFRNLQVLGVLFDHEQKAEPRMEISEIWDLPQLRDLELRDVCLPEPSSCRQDQRENMVLENLQSLRGIVNFRFDEAVLKRILNVKELKISYTAEKGKEESHYTVGNLNRLQKLESFNCSWSGSSGSILSPKYLQNIVFPQSLKKLVLGDCKLPWEDMSKVGSLPHLEKLTLKNDAFIGPEWNPVEGEFCCLKSLYINYSRLVSWNANSMHFPLLKQLTLTYCEKLKEIPLDIGEIPTLKLIQVRDCSLSAMKSAKAIAEEQQSLENKDLVVKVHSWYKVRPIHDSDPAELANFIATSIENIFKGKEGRVIDSTDEESDSN